MKVKKAIIPAAGLGTRFLPATKAQPKEMLPILDKPTLQIVIEEAVASGIQEILIITGRNKESIENHFDRNIELELHLEKNKNFEQLKIIKELSSLANIYYIRQSTPLGLGHAISCAKSFVGNEPFAILLGDEIIKSKKPALSQLIDVYNTYNKSVLAVREVEKAQTKKYGIIKPEKKIDDKVFKICDLIEKPGPEKAPSNIAIFGRYILSPTIFNILENLEPGLGGEIQLTDGIKELLKVEDVYSYEFDGLRYDVGSKLGYLQATVETALERDEFKDDVLNYLKNIVLKYKE